MLKSADCGSASGGGAAGCTGMSFLRATTRSVREAADWVPRCQGCPRLGREPTRPSSALPSGTPDAAGARSLALSFAGPGVAAAGSGASSGSGAGISAAIGGEAVLGAASAGFGAGAVATAGAGSRPWMAGVQPARASAQLAAKTWRSAARAECERCMEPSLDAVCRQPVTALDARALRKFRRTPHGALAEHFEADRRRDEGERFRSLDERRQRRPPAAIVPSTRAGLNVPSGTSTTMLDSHRRPTVGSGLSPVFCGTR